MKRKMICALIFLISVSFLLFMNACKKELQKPQNNSEVSSDLSHKVLILVDNFLKKKSSNIKDGEVMSVDSTIWYLETSMNVTYARLDSSVKIFKQDSAFISVPLNQDGSVNISDVYTAYAQLVDSLSAFYYSIEGTKSVIVNDVFAAAVTISQLQIGVNIILAQMPDPGIISPWFGADQNSKWGFSSGKCIGTYVGRDATTELARHANYTIPIAPSGQHYTWIDLVKSQIINPYMVPLPSGQQNPYGFENEYLFDHGGGYPEYDECLAYDAMNYYLQNLFTISGNYQPQGKEVVNYYCDFDFAGDQNSWEHMHKAQFTYGRRIIAYYDAETVPPNVK